MEQAHPLDGIASVRVGHWTDAAGRTGCTVVVYPRSLATVVDVRGGAPGTRETDVLGPGNLVRRADAILLTGGSAFGLAAADGVMLALRQAGRGFPTAAGPVPIVPAAVLFDLAVGEPVWPTAQSGRTAFDTAAPIIEVDRGAVGAGTGATVGKILGLAEPGGVGVAAVPVGSDSVTAIIAVNAMGVVGGTDPREAFLAANGGSEPVRPGENTTIGVVILDAAADAVTLTRCAIAAHDGLARAIVPCHTIFDGDTLFVSTLRDGSPLPGDIARLAVATELAVEAAVRDAVAEHPRLDKARLSSPQATG